MYMCVCVFVHLFPKNMDLSRPLNPIRHSVLILQGNPFGGPQLT